MTDLLDIITAAFAPSITSSRVLPKVYARTYCPPITKVIDNNPTTVVMFNDGSKSVVKCSPNDTYNLETAILYAIVKRTFGKVDPATAEATCPGLGNSLKEIIEKLTISGKCKKNASHPKCCAEDSNADTCDLNLPKLKTKPTSEERNTASCDWIPPKTKPTSKIAVTLYQMNDKPGYVRPNKPFSKFTQEEKRAYWRWQKSK